MCYDLNDYDPFEPLYIMEYDGSLELDTEPLNDYDWEQWLETMENDNEHSFYRTN